MSTASGTAFMKLSCHCGANSFSFPVVLPINKKYKSIRLCVCSDCRYQNGTLAGSFVPAPSVPFDPDSPPSGITVYRSSDIAARYFCSTCSCQLLFRQSLPELAKDEGNGFWIATGGLQLPSGEQFEVDAVNFVDCALDGGLASWLPSQSINKTLQANINVEDVSALEIAAKDIDNTDILEGKCHCGKVNIALSRPGQGENELPPKTWGDNTDLMVPYYTPREKQPPIVSENPWWIREEQVPGKGKRFLGGLCTCASCRTIAGVEVQSWIFVPTVCIKLKLPDGSVTEWPSREQLVTDERFENVIGTYQSTAGDPGVLRGYCKTCGANIFWDGLTRQGLIDISAGIFTHRGIREEAWIEWWTERVSYVEDAEGRHCIGQCLEQGLKDWKKRLGGHV
ncbi:hypothetical protein DRE_04147 [Drechslerella stenobrocha 248]|uniref:CENP-V/GFA domain-containing protein n=1 Tax=Drechslerella stenobrocha 248 TaxID=1043628 RepID=W7IC43_9PEZI|nr:hypothetical protein DRE_04147 [Drechslerella stenobrocha 248]